MFVGLPCLEGARYKYLTNCSRLLSPTSPFSQAHTRTHHQPDSSPPGLAQWAYYKNLTQHMGPEQAGPCPKEQQLGCGYISIKNIMLLL